MMTAIYKTLMSLLIIMACIEQTYAGNKVTTASIEKIDRFLTDGIKNGFSGAVMIAEKDVILLNKGYGMADKNQNIAIAPETVFDIGSNTKQFTAAAILLLMQQDKLKLTDPISSFFNDVPTDKKNITIHHLLSHTSGLIESVGRDFEHTVEADFWHAVFSSQLKHPIGSNYSYSNIGYSVLAKIIEIVTDQEYEAFLQAHIFRPIGMKQTGYLLADWNDSHLAKGYTKGIVDRGSMIDRYLEDKKVSWHLKGNGGINSTHHDMLLWLSALKKHEILNHNSFDLLMDQHAVIDEGRLYYGYGWGVVTGTDRPTKLSHNGSNGSFAHTILWFVEKDIVILFATNAASLKTERLAKPIESLIFDENYVVAPLTKNPYLAVIDFTNDHSYDKSNDLYAMIKAEYATDFDKPEVLNRLGYLLLDRKNREWAIEVFKINGQLFPNNSRSWEALGDVYLENDQLAQAKLAFVKAIGLGSEYAIDKIQVVKPQ